MSLPSTVSFAVGDLDYIAKWNQFVTDLNAAYNQWLTTQAPTYFVGSSVTSLSVAVGSKSITLSDASARAWTVGQNLRISSSASPANYMEGQVTAYAHPSLTVNVTSIAGTGTLAAWSIGLANPSALITSSTPGTATANQFVKVNAAGNAIVGVTGPAYALTDEVAWFLNR